MRADGDVPLERIPIHLATAAHVVAAVHRAQVAHVVGQQGLLAARIRGFVGAKLRDRIVAVRFVNEEHARFTRAPRAEDHLVPDFTRAQLANDRLGNWIDEVVVRVGLHGVHKRCGDADRNIEVGDLREIFFARDELHHVRMIHTQNAHVRTATRAALFHGIRAGIIQLHERHRARRHSSRRTHHGASPTQLRKRKPRAAAALMDERHGPQRVIDPVVPVR